jgi:osmotically-inducible protein OsmY
MNAGKPGLTVTPPHIKGMAESPDVWLTTRARIVLLTTEGVTVSDGFIEAHGGVVTLRGTVSTRAEQEKAGLAVGGIDGVKAVRNFVRVVEPKSKAKAKPTDQEIKERVEKALMADKTLEGLKVAAVDHGVVRMSGQGVSLTGRLRAIELAWNVAGVASEGETDKPTDLANKAS